MSDHQFFIALFLLVAAFVGFLIVNRMNAKKFHSSPRPENQVTTERVFELAEDTHAFPIILLREKTSTITFERIGQGFMKPSSFKPSQPYVRRRTLAQIIPSRSTICYRLWHGEDQSPTYIPIKVGEKAFTPADADLLALATQWLAEQQAAANPAQGQLPLQG